MLLADLAAVMKAGSQAEWAGVFGHFGHELAFVQEGRTLDPAGLRRLVRNIRLCFGGSSGSPGPHLEGRDAGETAALNMRLTQLKAETERALEEIELRLVEFIN